MEDQPDEFEMAGCTERVIELYPELFHYTGASAFESIVTSGTFWASPFRDLDDKDEVIRLRSVLPRVVAPRIQESIRRTIPWHKRSKFLAANGGTLGVSKRLIEAVFDAVFSEETRYGAMDAFIVSFSTHHRDEFRRLGSDAQWKAYAPKDGYCLVLDTASMAGLLRAEADTRQWLGPWLRPVRYDSLPHEQLFSELVDGAAADWERMLRSEASTKRLMAYLEGASLLKGVAYQSEEEIRIFGIAQSERMTAILAREHSNEYFRQPIPEIHRRADGRRRFVKLFEGLGHPLPIKRVIVGPTDDPARAVARARALLPETPILVSSASVK